MSSHPYGLLAASVAGQVVALADGDEERAWSDGEVIYLPAEQSRAGVVVQAALLASGSLDPKVVAKTTGRRALRLRYLTLEALRATHELDTLPRGVVRRVREVYDGKPPTSPEDSVKRAKSGEKVPEAPEWMGTIKPTKVILNSGSVGGSSPTKKQQEKGTKENHLEEFDDEDETEESKIMELFSTPLKQNPISDAIQKFLGAGRSPKPDGSGGDEVPTTGSRIGRTGKNAKEAEAPPDLELGLGLLGPPVGRTYPEWDWQKQRYKPDYTSVFEYDPRPPEEPRPLDADDDGRLRRELARLGLAQERHRRQQDGDALDVTSLIEYVVDRSTGAQGDDRVYESKRRTAHDLGVIVLLDVTGSTADSDEGKRVFDDQREVAARLISTLDELGDRVAGFGFQSYGRNGVRFLRIKEFDDRYDLSAQKRLAAMEPGGFTRLGAAVRHGTYLVTEKSGTINTLLIVVGDGLPYDDGYEHRYAQEDSRKALSEAVDRGVACACISVKTSTDEDVVERVWGHVPHIKLERVADLHREVLPVFRRSLREAVLGGRDGRRAA